MHTGYIKLWRKFSETSFFKNSHAVHLVIYLLLKCNHESKKEIWKKQELIIDRGQCRTTLPQLSFDTGISVRSLRTSLEVLSRVGFLTVKTTNKFRLISIDKYSDYQDKPTDKLTDKRQTNDRQENSLDIKKDLSYKNVKNTESKSPFMIPEWIDPKTWATYLEIRKAKRATDTIHALELIVQTLDKFRKAGQDPKVVLEKSIMSGWTGVFPLKDSFGNRERPRGEVPQTFTQSELDKINEEHERKKNERINQ